MSPSGTAPPLPDDLGPLFGVHGRLLEHLSPLLTILNLLPADLRRLFALLLTAPGHLGSRIDDLDPLRACSRY